MEDNSSHDEYQEFEFGRTRADKSKRWKIGDVGCAQSICTVLLFSTSDIFEPTTHL